MALVPGAAIDRDLDPQGLAPTDPPLLPTAGALGDEHRSSRRRRGHKHKGRSGGEPSSKRSRHAVAPPVYSDAPLSEKDNLAGRVDAYVRSGLGVKKQEVKVARPYHQVNLTAEPFVTFSITASKSEFIRFRPDSLSLVFYGNYLNDARVIGDANPQVAAQRWAFRARQSLPRFYCDPSVGGTGIFHKVEVSIDNVPVNSNSELNSLLLHYVRASRVFTNKPQSAAFLTNADLNLPVAPDGQPIPPVSRPSQKEATAPFDHTIFSATTGSRLPVYLDGIFPFSLKNATVEAIDQRKDPYLYFPPDTNVTIKLHAHRTKFESFFHPEIANNMDNYWNEAVIGDPAPLGIRFTIQDALMEYDSVELHPVNHAELIKAYRNGGRAVYNYDRVCCQHTALMPDLSSVQTRFQVPPFARLVYIMFLPDHATFVMDQTRRPISALTRFPAHCSGLTVSFAGSGPLVSGKFENFGIPATQVEITKKIYYEYLKRNRMIAFDFDSLFPKEEGEYSVVQAMVFDLRNLSSDKTETLTVETEYAGEHNSPRRRHILAMTVHPSGQLECFQEFGRWNWQFLTRTM